MGLGSIRSVFALELQREHELDRAIVRRNVMGHIQWGNSSIQQQSKSLALTARSEGRKGGFQVCNTGHVFRGDNANAKRKGAGIHTAPIRIALCRRRRCV